MVFLCPRDSPLSLLMMAQRPISLPVPWGPSLAVGGCDRLAGVSVDILDAVVDAAGRRAIGDRSKPAPEARKLAQVLAVWGVRHDPRIAGDVRDRVRSTTEVVPALQPAIEHRVEAPQFPRVALDRLGYSRRRVDSEVAGLARHRPQPGHLPEQPFQGFDAGTAVLGQQLAGLLREIKEDRAGFEHRDRSGGSPWRVVDDGRDLAVRRNGEESWSELLTRRQADREDPMRQRGFLEEQPDLQAVRRRAEIEVDQDWLGRKPAQAFRAVETAATISAESGK